MKQSNNLNIKKESSKESEFLINSDHFKMYRKSYDF
jgi:hypothetical protein